jgi:hypothetical protein
MRSAGQDELLEFKITQSSADAKIWFFIKKKARIRYSKRKR